MAVQLCTDHIRILEILKKDWTKVCSFLHSIFPSKLGSTLSSLEENIFFLVQKPAPQYFRGCMQSPFIPQFLLYSFVKQLLSVLRGLFSTSDRKDTYSVLSSRSFEVLENLQLVRSLPDFDQTLRCFLLCYTSTLWENVCRGYSFVSTLNQWALVEL